MSDPYIPPRPGIPPISSVPGNTPGAEYNRTTINAGSPSQPATKSGGGGFSTGMVVAAVFVVVALLAYAFLNSTDRSVPAPASSPAVTIENSNSPSATVPDATQPLTPAPADPAPTDVAPADPAPAAPAPAAPAPANP